MNKHPRFVVHHEQPLNGGSPLDLLVQTAITPLDLFYVRNHGTVPTIDPATYRLTVRGEQFSLDDLRQNFPRVERTATLQCAGNRRRELLPDADPTEQVMWGAEAISTGVWAGVRLADVLRAVGLPADARHVAFVGLDECEKDGATFGFGGSIPLEKALHPEVLLADTMNGEPLPPVHGFPLRLIAPGYVAARSVKWLGEIILQPEPSSNYFQQRDYKLFPPHVTESSADWQQGEMLGKLTINAVIATPAEGGRVAAGNVRVTGYALAGGDYRLQSVELSLDGGKTWRDAVLAGEPHLWVWQLWHADISLPPGEYTLVVRAHDTFGAKQPATAVWNFRGYMNNAWHHVHITVE